MYEFLTGPMLWAAFLIFVIGLARRVVLYIRGLDWRLERVAYGPGRKIGMKGAISSFWDAQLAQAAVFHHRLLPVPYRRGDCASVPCRSHGHHAGTLRLQPAFAAHVVLRRLYGARHRRCVYDDPAPRRVAGSPLPNDAGRLGYPVAGAVRARRRIPRPYAGPRL